MDERTLSVRAVAYVKGMRERLSRDENDEAYADSILRLAVGDPEALRIVMTVARAMSRKNTRVSAPLSGP